MIPVMGSAFRFWGCSEIRESLSLQADSERQLMERLEVVPAESIYYHTVRSLLRRRVVPTPYPDDFASWVATELRDAVLAERLALPSPFDFQDVEAFREHLLDILDNHLAELPFTPRVLLGSPFYFLRGHLVAVPLGAEANDLETFRRVLAGVDESSVYYHAVEAIGRLGKQRGDFAAWVEEVLGLTDLARSMAEVDPFLLSLAGVRRRLLQIVDAAMASGVSP
jgi:hypothetical protein